MRNAGVSETQVLPKTSKVKTFLKDCLPYRVYVVLSSLKYRRFSTNWRDFLACLSLLRDRSLTLSFREKLSLIEELYVISFNVHSLHTQAQMLAFMRAILSRPSSIKGVVVEAGCYKGGSTAKFSLAADIAGRKLIVFDSFAGIPKNSERDHAKMFGGRASFNEGDYCGTLADVKANVAKFGKINRCRFVPGWFDETMAAFKEPVVAIYLDVDLASSTRCCLKYLYPLLQPGGVLFSSDGDIPLVIDVFDDDDFWLNEVGCKKPQIHGLRKTKLIKIVKDTQV